MYLLARCIYLCVSVCIYGECLHSSAYASVGAYTGLHMCGGPKADIVCPLKLLSTLFLRQGFLLNLWLANWLDWLASGVQGPSSHPCLSDHAGISDIHFPA